MCQTTFGAGYLLNPTRRFVIPGDRLEKAVRSYKKLTALLLGVIGK